MMINLPDQHSPDMDTPIGYHGRHALASALASACERRGIPSTELPELPWHEKLALILDELGGQEMVDHIAGNAGQEIMEGEAQHATPVITLAEWARRKGLARRLVTDWAARGYFNTAYQVGESWMVSPSEPIPPQPYGRAAKEAREREQASRSAPERARRAAS